MTKRFMTIFFNSLILLLLLLLLSPSSLFALDDLYDAPGIDSYRETISSIPEEHIDPFTGGVTLNHIDAKLPGNGGLDFVIQRSFNSKEICYEWTNSFGTWSCTKDGERTWMGFGWRLHFGRLFVKTTNINDTQIIEMPDGSKHVGYKYNGSMSQYITKDQWIIDYTTNPFTVTLTNGTKIYYGQSAPLDINSRYLNYNLYLATKIEDANGNTINIYYQNYSGATVPYYAMDSVGRRIDFYYSTVNGGVYLTRISGPGIDIDYAYDPITGLSGAALLQSVTFPLGPPWSYAYNKTLMDLTSVGTTSGGSIAYTYNFSSVSACGSSFTYRTITQKQNSGRDIPSGTWTLAYSQGTNSEFTNVTDPCGRTIKYGFYGYGSSLSDGQRWQYGLPKSKEIVGEETITYSWTNSASISDDDYVIPYCGRDYYVYAPRLTSQAITRDGKTYTTSYSSYDAYGNPQSISETGDKNRNRSISYWTSPLRNIVLNKPSSETVSGDFSGSFMTNYSYDTDGNLTQINKYGVTTSYGYFGNGNLSLVTDANNHITSYQWNNGRISQITYPGNIYNIFRSISADGTIASETNGRNYTTYYYYDANLRLTSIDPPVGNTTYYEYPSDNSYKKETRGSFYTYYYLDGFGRPSGTSDSKGVTTDVVYKACGTKNYTDSSVGDKTYFDNFGRVTSIVHKDNNDIAYSYSNSNVTVSDENNGSTTLTYNAFGNPDEKFLVSVRDAATNTTSYDYNMLGALTSVTQGSISRTFVYDSTKKAFLYSETHPETGTITYGRDNVGNMTSKTDSYGTKSYTYDGLNRLTQISYGSGTVNFGYDNADNRTSMDNPSASIDYTYDAANVLTQKTETIAGRAYTTTYGYDNNDNLTDLYYPAGRHVTYTYNSNNQVTAVNGFGKNISSVSYSTSGNTAGLPTSFTTSTGITTNLSYNARNFTTGITAASGNVLNMGYGYDTRGNTTSITNSGNNQSFTYDSLNRLLTFNGAWGTGSYSYDASGNRSTKTVGGSTASYYYSSNRLSSTSGSESSTLGYNSYGSLTSATWQGNSYSMVYDNLNNLTAYKLGSTSLGDYSYDGDGMRVTKTSSEGLTVYHYDKEGKVLEESDSSGNLIADYVYMNGKLIAKVANDAFIAPNTPSNLTATPASSTQINLNWTDNSTNEQGFRIYRSSVSGGPYSYVNAVSAGVTTYSDTGRTAKTTYYYVVTAYNAGGESAYSNEANATTPAGPLDHFRISTISSPQTAGTPFSVTITAQDASNNTATSFAGTVNLSTTAGSINPLSTTTFTNGVWTGSVTVTGAGAGKTISATDPTSAKTGTSNTFTVNAGALNSITISPSSAAITAGNSQSYTTASLDAYGNSLGDVTSSTVFTISPNGSCSGATCTATVVGAHTVTGTYSSKTATASLAVNAGTLNSITIAPASAVITAGGSQSYTATGFDQYNNSLGDVTSSTSFSISPNGSCTGASCTATVAGAHTIMGNDSGKTATASLTVNAGAVNTITISPLSATITAGGSQSYTAQGTDAYGNSLGDVTSSTAFTISPNGSCTGATCTAIIAGAHTVTGANNGKAATASLAVSAGALDHITIGPALAIVTAGGSQTYTASSFDAYGNSLGDVTSSTVFTISPNGSCTGATCTATIAGAHTVTGTYSGKTATASLTVNAGSLNSITISPASATITAGGSQSYTATGFDQYSNSLGNVTSSTVFTISPNGSCTGATCTATIAGAHTVTGTNNGKTATASLTVNAGSLNSITISPSSASITAGNSQGYTASSFDAYGNSLGDVTSSTVLTISPNGSCTGATCTATVAGAHTVTGTYSGKTATASLTVNPGSLNSIAISPASAVITAGGSQSYTATGFDQYSNSLGNVTSSTIFTISPDGSCTGATCTATVAGAHTVTGTYSGKTATASLTVNAGAVNTITISPLSATITAGGSQSYTAQGTDIYGNSLGNVTSSTVFTISPNGSCTGATCTATIVGAHTVTGTNNGKTTTASLTVNAGSLNSITISPSSASITAGNSQGYTASSFDAYGNSLGDVTGSTVFTISPNGSCTGSTCTATIAGAHTVTGTYSGKTATASLTVYAGALNSITISPASATMTAGGSQSYTATGFDQYSNSLGNVTSSTVFTISPNGSCTGATCTATVAGVNTVTGNDSGKTATASLTVNAGALYSITISPLTSTIIAGESQCYTAAGFDQYGNSIYVADSTTFTISPNGSCIRTCCTATVAGAHTVTGNDGGKTAVASLMVNAGAVNAITISPASAAITAGGSQAYTAQGTDVYGNSLGDVTSSTVFTISPDGSCAGASCTATVAGAHAVTGNDSGKTSTASLTVNAGAFDHIAVNPASATITAGGSQSYTVTSFDQYGNSLGDVTSSAIFTISPNGSCTGATCMATVAGVHTVTGNDSGKTATASLTAGAGAAVAFSVTAPVMATGDSPFDLTVTARDVYNNAATDYNGTVHFTSTDSNGGIVLPNDYVFQSGDNGSHTFTAGVTLETTGTQTITVTDQSSSSVTGTSGSISVNPDVAARLSVTAAAVSTAGAAIDITVSAKDVYGNTITDYVGTVHFTSTDSNGGIVLPGDYIFQPDDNGSHTFIGAAILKTAGAQTITVTDQLNSSINGTSGSIAVRPDAVAKLSVTAPASSTAGVAFDFIVTAKDVYDNTVRGYAGTVIFASSDTYAGLPAEYAFVSMDNGTHTFTAGATLDTAGTQTITVTDQSSSSINGTSGNIEVGPSALYHITISPVSAIITAGGSQAYTAQGTDAYGNSLGDVTGSTIFTISPDGSCTGASCTATVAGIHTVTGNDSGKTAEASLMVNAGAVNTITISPVSAIITAGGSQAYTAQGTDAYGNSLGDVTGSTIFTISPDGSCTGASCTATVAGIHTVTGNDSGKTATASLTVNAGALDHITISPASAIITAGNSQGYTASSFDAYGNSLGDVTSSTSFSISPNGSCAGASCTATVAGIHTVTGNDSGKTATVSLAVNGGALDHITISPASAIITAGDIQSYTASSFDAYGNNLGDVTGSTTFAISPNGSCAGAICTATIAGAHMVTGDDGGKTATASLTVNYRPVRIAGAIPTYYSTLQEAYDAAINGDVIQSQARTFAENLSVNRNISVTLQGGYDIDYTTNSGNVTVLKGMIQTFAGGGTLRVGNFKLARQ